jgi:transcriptional regulator of acetoin/glycerol metabolism
MKTFTDHYGHIVSPFVKKYQMAKNEKARKALIKSAADAVSLSRNLQEDEGVDLPKDLPTVCLFILFVFILFLTFLLSFPPISSVKAITRYIKRSIKKESTGERDEPKPTKIKEFYTIRDVVKQHYRALLEEEIPHKSSEKEYIGKYQGAVTAVIKKMSEEDLEEAERIVDLWNEQGAPPEVQLK